MLWATLLILQIDGTGWVNISFPKDGYEDKQEQPVIKALLNLL